MKGQRHFPLHMKRAVRSIEEMMDLVDLVVETVDARVPRSGRNPLLASIVRGKVRCLVLTKSNLADPRATRIWLKRFREEGENAFAVSVLEGFGRRLVESTLGLSGGRGERRGGEGAGLPGGLPRRIMIVGIPNSGKSTLINAIAGKHLARTGKRPGITRGYQWVKVENGVLVLDTPGVLPVPLLDRDPSRGAWRLAAVGALEEGQYDREEAALFLLDYLLRCYPHVLTLRSSVPGPGDEINGGLADDVDDLKEAHETLSVIAVARGCVGAGGLPDLSRASGLILKDFRDGRLGRVTLDRD